MMRSLFLLGGFAVASFLGSARAHAECGDGVREAREGCDDGNRRSEDGCSSTCRVEMLQCDGQALLNPAAAACVNDAQCGQGNRCDRDGCTPSACGCAEGGHIYCTTDCLGVCVPDVPREPAVCGNGVLEEGEGCDDGNRRGEDGCSATCRAESFRCAGELVPNESSNACINHSDCGSGNRCDFDLCVPSVCGCEEGGYLYCTLDCLGGCVPGCPYGPDSCAQDL